MLNKKKSKITFIIRTKNEERWVGHAIQSVLDRVYRPEILIIDNNSNDKTLKIVKYFMHDPELKDEADHPSGKNYTDLRILNIKNYTPGAALNLGIKNASNNIIVIMSAHCVLKKFNLDKISKELKKYACIFGNQIPIWEGKKLTKRYIWSHFTKDMTENLYSDIEDRYFLHNAFCFYNKSFLEENPFDED